MIAGSGDVSFLLRFSAYRNAQPLDRKLDSHRIRFDLVCLKSDSVRSLGRFYTFAE